MNRILYSSGTATSDEAAADLGMFQSWIMNILLQKWGAATESEHVLGFWAQEKCDGVCVCVYHRVLNMRGHFQPLNTI